MIYDSEADSPIIRYYRDVDILQFAWSWHEVPNSHLQPNERQILERDHGITTIRTGNMDGHRFDRLKRSIAEEGVLNPFIIEYYRKDLPNGAGHHKTPVLAVRTGNNRAEAMNQLGLRRAPALFVVPQKLAPALPSDPYEDIPINSGLLERIDALWDEVVRAPEDNHDGRLGTPRAWTDSNLLLEIVRSTLDNPNSLQRVRQTR